MYDVEIAYPQRVIRSVTRSEPKPQLAIDYPRESYTGFWAKKICQYKVCIGFLLFVVLAVFTVCIPLLVIERGREPEITTDKEILKKNCYIATYTSQVSMETMQYNSSLSRRHSEEFNTFATMFCQSLNENLEDLYECGEKVESCRVDSFQPGSIIVNTIIRHTKFGKIDDLSEAEKEKETIRIQDIIYDSIEKGKAGGNPSNLFYREPATLQQVKAADVEPYVQCPPLQVPARSEILSLNPFVNYVGDSLTVQCDKGTFFPGHLTIASVTCLSSGKWSRELNDCKPKFCPDIKESLLENAELQHGKLTGNEYKDTVSIKCDPGYAFDLEDALRTVFCEEDGEWNKDLDTGCQDINECSSMPCQNSGTCHDEIGEYSCTCQPGYTGHDCETDINDCLGITCQNDGACIDGVDGFECFCLAGYNGTYCESNMDECASSPCENDGTCVDDVNGYSCTCTDGFVGDHCETNFYECYNDPCINGGTCTDQDNSYTCACVDGFTGTRCETNIDECDSSPCQNDGICDDRVNGYECYCGPSWVGSECQTNALYGERKKK